MLKNKILDYEQVKDELDRITKKKVIKRASNIGISEYGLDIEQYIVGNGINHIVISGATHGCEIITTDFILKLMGEISDNNREWINILSNFTIHFIPILNPEGYLISTSAIRKMIPRNMPLAEAENLCKKYYEFYRSDDITDSDIKKHQEMFKKIDYTCISEDYPKIREAIKNIFEIYPDLPKGCLQTWSSNAMGIDIQANSEYNPAITKINNGETIYMKSKRNNNINIAHPGPINCPFDKTKGQFKKAAETEAIEGLLENLYKNNKLFAYLNYHSTGGMIFQRPAIMPESLNISKEELFKKELFNYLCARTYSEETVRDKVKNQKYTIYPKGLPNINDNNKLNVSTDSKAEFSNINATSLNDILRLKYSMNLLIELSGMGGNPIGPYGDINGNYANVMGSNLKAVKHLLENAQVIKMVSDECTKVFSKFGNKAIKSEGEYYRIKTILLDYIYIELKDKFESLSKLKDQNKEDYENR